MMVDSSMPFIQPQIEKPSSCIDSYMVVKSPDIEVKNLQEKFCHLLVDLGSNLTLDQINFYKKDSSCPFPVYSSLL